jgi:alpha-amylase/alpha-mannosidase (GH57 family)
MERYLCIHGHFYQPPRENPWIEAIEVQDSAHPYHDWNERITAECYAPNAASRILDERGTISRIVNNYERISFNFGPTLLSWMEKGAPELYRAILEADRKSAAAFSGHGSALAQPYNHMILPLATPRDKRTQVLWGLRDFERRFGRRPEGMWLPETAVDLETLEILAAEGLQFTILGPHQARRVREMGEARWRNLEAGEIDPTMAYRVRLGSGRTFALFFYDGPISRDISFGGLLDSGEAFVGRLLGAFSDQNRGAQLVHVATDGEVYGHHHRFGEMALSFVLEAVTARNLGRLTNYGEYLERHPPTHEVEIQERSSWSCSHGVARWESDCGCTTGSRPGWNQAWRRPLRQALDFLRDALATLFEEKGAMFFVDPWAARDAYIELVLDRSPGHVDDFLRTHGRGILRGGRRKAALRLLEIQRHSMLMYTSCGWFFADLSGIETLQILQYAGRALTLADRHFGTGLEDSFLSLLRQAKSNDPERGDGARIYERFVRTAAMDVEALAAHYAVRRLRGEDGRTTSFYVYDVEERSVDFFKAGKARLAIGKARFTSRITRGSVLLNFAALHLGDHNVTCGVGPFSGRDDYRALAAAISNPFLRGDLPGTVRLMDRAFGGKAYSLKSLIRDEQRSFLAPILQAISLEAENVFRAIYEENAPLMRFLKDARIPPPSILYTAAQNILNATLKRSFHEGRFDRKGIAAILSEAGEEGVALDLTVLEYTLRRTMERIAGDLLQRPEDLTLLDQLGKAVDLMDLLPFRVQAWKIQNILYEIVKNRYPQMLVEAEGGKGAARRWVSAFKNVSEKLSLRLGS